MHKDVVFDQSTPDSVSGTTGYFSKYVNAVELSNKGIELTQTTAPNFPGFLLTYDEVQFYLAEAAAREWNVGSSAEAYFNSGVTASILEWGGTETEASDFLAAHPYTSYENWKDAIGTQDWISMYTRGFIGYTFYRRLDYPKVLVMPPNPPTGVDVIPTRFTYPINEQTLNKANYTAASEAIGGDLLTTKLFWDIN